MTLTQLAIKVKFKIITVTEEIEKCSQVLARFLAKESTRADMEDTAERYKNALMELAGLGRIKDPKILTLFPVDFKQLMVSVFSSKDETYSISYFPESYVLGLSKFDRILMRLVKRHHRLFDNTFVIIYLKIYYPFQLVMMHFLFLKLPYVNMK